MTKNERRTTEQTKKTVALELGRSPVMVRVFVLMFAVSFIEEQVTYSAASVTLKTVSFINIVCSEQAIKFAGHTVTFERAVYSRDRATFFAIC